MKSFFHVQDIGDLGKALEEAKQVKATPYAWQHLGKNKTIILVFFNKPAVLSFPSFPAEKLSS